MKIRITQVKVYELHDEVSIIEHNGKMKDKTVKKPKLVLNQELDKTINLDDLKNERDSYKKNKSDSVQFTYDHIPDFE